MGFSPGTLSMASSDMNAASSGAPAANTAGTKMDSQPQERLKCSHEVNGNYLTEEQQLSAAIKLSSTCFYINSQLT